MAKIDEVKKSLDVCIYNESNCVGCVYREYEGGFCIDALMKDALDVISQMEVVRGRWKDNRCTVCGMMPMGDELWDQCDFAPPKFEMFMDYCPNCGAKMDGERKNNENECNT